MKHWIANLNGGNIPYFSACGVIESALRRKIGPTEPLGNHAEIFSGYAFESKDFVSDGIRLLRNINVKPDQLDWTETACLTPQKAANFDRFRLCEGDLVMSMDGPITRQGLKIAFVGRGDLPALLLQRVCRLDSKATLNRRYLFHILHSDDFIRHLTASNRSIAIPHVSAKQLREFEIPLIPLAEQIAVADFLDAVQRKIPIAEWPTLPSQLSLEGRIVSRIQDLGTRVEEARQLRRQSNAELEVALLNNAARMFRSKGTTLVGDFARIQSGYAFKSDWFTESGIRLVRNVNIGHGHIMWRETARIPEDRCGEFARFELSRGDILVSLDRPIISTGVKVAWVTDEDLPSLLLQRVGRVSFVSEGVLPEYFFAWLRSPRFTLAIDPGRSNGIPHISPKDVERIPFTPPPIEEQRRIVAYLDDLHSKSDAVRKLQSETGAELDALMPSILSRAFRGEL